MAGSKSGKKSAKKTSSAKKTTKKAAKKVTKKAPAKKKITKKNVTSKKVTKKTSAASTKTATSKKTTKKGSAKKMTAKKTAKKTTASKTAKKTTAKKVTKKASAAMKSEEKPVKSDKKVSKKISKATAKSKAAAKSSRKKAIANAVAAHNVTVSVQIGPTHSILQASPGARLTAPKKQVKEQVHETEIRKLTRKELNHIKEILLEKREELLHGIRKELADSRMRSGQMSADPVDQAADSYDSEVSFEIAAANDEELEEIEVALDKISKGTYGECEDCGEMISPSRLRILPFANSCKHCRIENETKKRSRRNDGGWAFLNEDDSSVEE